jgi:GNAT superfamily N-acetyltransferase
MSHYRSTPPRLGPDMVHAPDTTARLGTRRGWRRRGLAGAFLAWALDAALAAGKASPALEVDTESPTGAVGVYERTGFVVTYRTSTHARPLETEIKWLHGS